LTADEFAAGGSFLDALADAAESSLDLDRLLKLAHPPALREVLPPPPTGGRVGQKDGAVLRVAVARDQAFCFYYEDNLDVLREAGAEIVLFSPLDDPELPRGVALVYLGGGYPEVFAERLSANASMRSSIRRFHADGGAIYAECGGLMACAEVLRDGQGRDHAMWGLIPARVEMQERFAALGYVTAETDRPSPFGPTGTQVRGHEFHFSRLEPLGPLTYVAHLLRPDRPPRPDAIQVGSLLAGYAHLHFGSNPSALLGLLRGGA
jgi:cobyrinic acid a,c-diamide synthase